MPIALLYHDVIARDQSDASGFPGGGAARYKLTPAEFRQHVNALQHAVCTPPVLAPDLLGHAGKEPGWLLTFDDGGISAIDPIADLLEENGWKGHFFITVNYIDSPTFVSVEHIRALHRRGHVIGSHSCSHPERMSACGNAELLNEWQRSREVLSDIVGEPVTTASVPGGYYSLAVAQAAGQAGFRVLFNSEPTTRPQSVDGCLVLGRYTIYRGMSAKKAAALAVGRFGPRLQQTLFWNIKKATKAAGGRLYLQVRKRLLTLAYERKGAGALTAGQEQSGRAAERGTKSARGPQ
ncbi:MAG TPA: polysaccharide deacetylase family protein [Gemmataceae bacterium]|nr:polysaccharide deacetylase family protein [Gemmataceae bacterium]